MTAARSLRAACAVVVARARTTAPDEVCGFLARGTNGYCFVEVPNRARGRSFYMHPRDVERVQLLCARRGWRLAALVHSHAAGVAPSTADRTAMHASRWPWIIVDLAGGMAAHRPGATDAEAPGVDVVNVDVAPRS